MNDDYTPTTDEIRRAWWMDTDNPFDNEGASDVSFDRWLAAHDAALLAAHPATAIDRDTLIEFFTRCTIQAKAIDGVVTISAESMADALLASGVLNGQKEQQ